MSLVKHSIAIFKKDMLLELRGKESLSLMLFLSLLLLVIFNFAMDINNENVAALAPGILWVVFSFSGVLGMGRSSVAETDEDAYHSIVFSPASSESFYLGKVLSNLLFLLIMEVFTIVSFAILFNFELLITSLPALLAPLMLGTLGFSLIGTLFSFLTVTSRYGEVLLPFIYFPIVVPVILGGVTSTGAILNGGTTVEIGKWLQIMGVFDVIYLSASILLFRHLLEE